MGKLTEIEEYQLQQYKNLKRKRRKRLIILILSLFLLLGGSFVGYNYFKNKEEPYIPPSLFLKLNATAIEIETDSNIDYSSYIEEATIDDEDAIAEVSWNEVDTSVVGEYTITYKLEVDKQSVIKQVSVKISKKEEQEKVEPVEEEPTIEEQTPVTPTQPSPTPPPPAIVAPSPEPQPIKPTFETRYFRVSEYGTINAAESACYSTQDIIGGKCSAERDPNNGEYLWYILTP